MNTSDFRLKIEMDDVPTTMCDYVNWNVNQIVYICEFVQNLFMRLHKAEIVKDEIEFHESSSSQIFKMIPIDDIDPKHITSITITNGNSIQLLEIKVNNIFSVTHVFKLKCSFGNVVELYKDFESYPGEYYKREEEYNNMINKIREVIHDTIKGTEYTITEMGGDNNDS